MSGQPYRYSTDQAKYRTEYMKNLQERIDLDDMVLQAVKGYVSNGTLPAVSQLPDTRTTAEKLLDIQKIKMDMIKDLSPIMDTQIADRIIQGLIQSPLNSDNRLVIFFSQRAPEIVTQLQKIYKYGVKGDMNDITTFIEFINNMYLEKNKATASIKSFIDRSGTTGQSMTTKDDLLNLKVTYSNFCVDLGRKIRPTGAEGEMIRDIGRRLDLLIQYLPTDQQIARLYEIIKDPTMGGQHPQVNSFLFMGPIDNLIDFINTSLPNKNIFYQLVQDFQNLVRPINKSHEEAYAEKEGRITERQYARAEVRRTKKIETSTMDLLTRLSSILPTEEALMSIFTPQILEFLKTEVDLEPPKISQLNTGIYRQQPYTFGASPPREPLQTSSVEQEESAYAPIRTIKVSEGAELSNPRFGKVLEEEPVQTIGERETGFEPSSNEDLVRFYQKFKEEERATENPSRQLISAIQRVMEEIQKRKDKGADFTVYGNKAKKAKKAQEKATIVEPEEDLSLQDIFRTIRGILGSDADISDYRQKVKGADLSVNQRETRIEQAENAIKTLLYTLQGQLEDLDKPTLVKWAEAKMKEPVAGQIERINELVYELGDADMKGFGFKKKRRGRPKGTGFKQNIERHIDTHKGIEPDYRYSKFGKYLIRNDHLLDNTVSIRTGKGMNITGLPSTKTNPKIINIIKKIIGGSLPTFDEMSKLSEDEKEYLHKISKKSNILEKLNIPTPSKDKAEKEFNEFEILRGEIMAGNDNRDMIRKFKSFLLRFSKTGQLPKQQVNEILQDMLDMNL